MTLEEAVNIVNQEFETVKTSNHSYYISTNKTYEGYHYYSVELYDTGEEVVLSDIGITKDYFDLKCSDEKTEKKEWMRICNENGFEFRDWRIVLSFNSIDDVYRYIDFLDYITDNFEITDNHW